MDQQLVPPIMPICIKGIANNAVEAQALEYYMETESNPKSQELSVESMQRLFSYACKVEKQRYQLFINLSHV